MGQYFTSLRKQQLLTTTPKTRHLQNARFVHVKGADIIFRCTIAVDTSAPSATHTHTTIVYFKIIEYTLFFHLLLIDFNLYSKSIIFWIADFWHTTKS